MANIRETILNIIIEYDRGGARKPSLLKDSLDKVDYLETRDKAFIKRVVEGTLERQIQIDYIIDSVSRTRVRDMQPFIRALMRMSTYQIMFMDQVPDSAACNEAVKLAKRHSFSGLSGFVNGVLRNISRNKDNIQYPDRDKDGGAAFLSAYYSIPEWICRMWLEEYGMSTTEEMLAFFLQPRPVTVRASFPTSSRESTENGMTNEAVADDSTKKTAQDVRTKKADEDSRIMAAVAATVPKLREDLEAAGCTVKESNILPYALDLEKTDNIRYLPGFEDGRFFVQDVSSMLVTEIAAPEPSQTVIDVCAAPGGKSLHAAERAEKVYAGDVSERKCDLIRDNAERLRISNIGIRVHDARIHDGTMENLADILYLDVPCSGLGIIGRKNDIKYNVTPGGLSEINALQWEIIKASYDYVRVGGIMMYSTCTVSRSENEDMVRRICEELPFERVDITDRIPGALLEGVRGEKIRETAGEGYIQLLPGAFGTDGFFIAKLRRIG